jgi:hypothetical protein
LFARSSLWSLPSSDNLFYVFASQKTLRKNIKNSLSERRLLLLSRFAKAHSSHFASLFRTAIWRKLAGVMAEIEKKTKEKRLFFLNFSLFTVRFSLFKPCDLVVKKATLWVACEACSQGLKRMFANK